MIDGGGAAEKLQTIIESATEPTLIKGLVNHWPMTQAACQSRIHAEQYLAQFYNGRPMVVYHQAAKHQGRIFYNETMSGFNFESSYALLPEILTKLNEQKNIKNPRRYYVGSTMVDQWLPGFREKNDLAFSEQKPLVSLWLGNQTLVPAHYDFPDNIACCVAGRRRFTLLPPDQLENLYIGPLDLTPSGQPISLVDFKNPDYKKFPKFKEAQQQMRIFELEAGDAIYIPSMWWHQVESLTDFNVLINYWWRSTPNYLGNPTAVLFHSLLTLRHLPASQKQAWLSLIEHYVTTDKTTLTHIPKAVLGVLGEMSGTLAENLKKQIIQKIN